MAEKRYISLTDNSLYKDYVIKNMNLFLEWDNIQFLKWILSMKFEMLFEKMYYWSFLWEMRIVILWGCPHPHLWQTSSHETGPDKLFSEGPLNGRTHIPFVIRHPRVLEETSYEKIDFLTARTRERKLQKRKFISSLIKRSTYNEKIIHPIQIINTVHLILYIFSIQKVDII